MRATWQDYAIAWGTVRDVVALVPREPDSAEDLCSGPLGIHDPTRQSSLGFRS